MPREFPDQYSFRVAIRRTLRQVHPDGRITTPAINELNLMIHYLAKQIVDHANRLVLNKHQQTMQSADIMSAIQLVLPGELAKHAMSDLSKAVAKYSSSKPSGARQKGAVRAGLVFPVKRTENIMRAHMTCERLSKLAPVALSAVLEYLTTELLKLAGNQARDGKRMSINTRDLMMAIEMDSELQSLFKEVTKSGGVKVGHFMNTKHVVKHRRSKKLLV
jgi:histone H3/H4